MPLHTIYDLADAINIAETIEKAGTYHSRYTTTSKGSNPQYQPAANSLPYSKKIKEKDHS